MAVSAAGQGTVEALRFSQVYHSGTARFSAMGGAFAALGGDASTLTYNPAGIGVYRGSEFSFTPHLLSVFNTAEYMGGNAGNEDYKFKFGLSHMAGIGSFKIPNSTLKYLNFGIAYNKTNHFSEASFLHGRMSGGGTLSDYFARVVNDKGVAPNNLPANSMEKMIWEGYAVDYDTLSGSYFAPYNDAGQEQRYSVSGMMGEYAFSVGGNVADVFYFGATIGVVSIEYRKDLIQTEYPIAYDVDKRDEKFDYTQNFRMDGSGYNFKAGFVLTPLAHLDFGSGLRIGAAVHTPTFLDMRDEYGARITYNKNNAEGRMAINEFRYGIHTPARYMAGVAYVFAGQPLRGIISADYEYVDYSRIKMREFNSDNQFDNVNAINTDIAANFTGVSNIRIGGEVGYGAAALRAGYALYGSPYKSSVGKDGSVNMFSVGLGFKLKRTAFMDLAYTRSIQSDKGYLYYYNEGLKSPEATYSITQNNFMITIGWRF